MGALGKLLTLPTFAFSLFLFYWSLPIFASIYWIRFANLTGKRNDLLDWTKSLCRFFGVTILKHGKESLYRGGKCVYLANHRSWADFFVDLYLTEGRGAFMSRWLVYFVFPVFCTSCLILRCIVFFKRGTIKDKEAFNLWLDGVLERSIVPGLIVYPEGHRSLLPTSLPLKRGMLHYAYGRRLPVQILMARGKEEVLSEKTQSARFGRTLVATYAKVLKPDDYKDFEAFWADVQALWDSTWKEVNSVPAQGLPRLVSPDEHAYDYPLATRLQQLAITALSMPICAGVVAGSCWTAARLLALTGPAQPVVVAVLVAWFSASLVHAFR